MAWLPKVTCNLDRFCEWSKLLDRPNSRYLNGAYTDGFMYVRKLSPLTLFHEFIHHIIGQTNNSTKIKYINLQLFRDFLNKLWDTVWFRFMHIKIDGKFGKGSSMNLINNVRLELNDWLDWVLCR